MNRAYLPFLFLPSQTAIDLIGRDLAKVAVLALRAILQHRKSLEVAHQQIRYGKHDLAFSSRINGSGELIIELDIGDPRLSQRLVLEEEFRRATRDAQKLIAKRRHGTSW
jgi:hypothetical protein